MPNLGDELDLKNINLFKRATEISINCRYIIYINVNIFININIYYIYIKWLNCVTFINTYESDTVLKQQIQYSI